MEAEDFHVPEQRFSVESGCNSTTIGSSMATCDKTVHSAVDTGPPTAKDAVTAATLIFELSTDIRVKFIAVYDEPKDTHYVRNFDKGSSQVEVEDACVPGQRFAFESGCNSTTIWSCMVTCDKTAHSAVDTGPPKC